VALIEHPINTVSARTIGAAIEVHRHLGPGLLESSYQSCLSRELELRGFRHRCHVELPLQYKGVRLTKAYVIDLLIHSSLVVEIKSVDKLLPIHASQLLTYMRLLKVSSGLLINFNVTTLVHGIKRVLF
jgi:GxxExxY protein